MNQPEPGFPIGHKVGEGVKLIGPGDPIELRVLRISGPPDLRSVSFSVGGLSGILSLSLTATDKFHKLTQDVSLKVLKAREPYMRDEEKAYVRYLIPSNYVLELINQSKTKPHFLQ